MVTPETGGGVARDAGGGGAARGAPLGVAAEAEIRRGVSELGIALEQLAG